MNDRREATPVFKARVRDLHELRVFRRVPGRGHFHPDLANAGEECVLGPLQKKNKEAFHAHVEQYIQEMELQIARRAEREPGNKRQKVRLLIIILGTTLSYYQREFREEEKTTQYFKI